MRRKAAGMCWLIVGGVFGALMLGCGDKEGSAPDKGKPAAAKAPAAEKKAPAEAKALAPGQAWAEKVAACYLDALKETVAATEGATAAEALPKLKAMKEKCIAALLPLGRKREGMDKAARSLAELAIHSKLWGQEGVGKTEDFKKYLQLANGPFNVAKAKTAEEKEAAALVTSVNIITQYAHFELLKKQEPKEAERLGIK